MKKDLLVYLKEALTEKKWLAIDNDICRRVILGYVLENGYQGGGYGYHNNNYTTYRGSSTVLELNRLFDEGQFEDVMCSEEVLRQMDEYADSIDLSTQGQYAGYVRECQDAWFKKPHIDKKRMSLLASFCNRYKKELEYRARKEETRKKQELHQQKVEDPNNRGAGQEGDQVRVVVKKAEITDTINPTAYYAPSYPVWTIVGEDGLTYTGGDTSNSVQLEPGDIIRGKIKKLREFRGLKTTQLVRVKVGDTISLDLSESLALFKKDGSLNDK